MPTAAGIGVGIVGLSASSEESAAAAGQAHGVKLSFGDTAEMVTRPEVNLVVVTVIVRSHLELLSASQRSRAS